MATDRRRRVLLFLERQPRTSVTEMAEILAIAPRTLRSDLRALLAEGRTFELYGDERVEAPAGERRHEGDFDQRQRANADAKREIARWAAGLVKDGDTILLDGSTTVAAMVPFLAGRRNLVVLTNGIESGRRMAENCTNSVILVAGVLQPDGASVVGPLYEPVLRNYHIKTAFVSCCGFSLTAGLTELDANEAAIKIDMVALAETTVLLADSSKFGRVFPSPFARADQVTHIFSDGGLAPFWSRQVQAASIVLTLCSPSSQVKPWSPMLPPAGS